MSKPETDEILKDFSYGITLNRLESLLLFAENASVTDAANKKNRAAESVTRHLNELDSYFGCPLRVRSGKKSIISKHGKELAALAMRHLQELKDFRDKHTNALNSVSFAAGDSLLHVVVLPHLPEILAGFVKTTISISAARTFEIIEGLQDFTLDIGLLRQSSVPREVQRETGEALQSAEIGDYRYAIFVPPRLWERIGKDESRIFGLPFAVIKHHWDTNFLSLARGKGVVFSDVRVLCENFIQVFHLLRLGEYAGILPLFCKPLLRGVECCEPAFLREPTHKVVLAWNPGLVKIKTKLKPFIDSTISELRKVFNSVAG